MSDSKKTNHDLSLNAHVDLQEVERLLEFMEKHGLEECEYERGNLHIRLKKPAAQVSITSHPAADRRAVYAPPAGVPASAGASSSREVADEPAHADGLHVVKSPIVGTLYASPSPDAEAFVKIGDEVKTGQVLCIIEAMKLMNEIESDTDGKVVRIFVENGHPVEYGEPLFGILAKRGK
ncbi:MAG: acetyl-CoA carboxylase biotin carboxyl carrier protein [Candidatus Acidiferrales bacterium]